MSLSLEQELEVGYTPCVDSASDEYGGRDKGRGGGSVLGSLGATLPEGAPCLRRLPDPLPLPPGRSQWMRQSLRVALLDVHRLAGSYLDVAPELGPRSGAMVPRGGVVCSLAVRTEADPRTGRKLQENR